VRKPLAGILLAIALHAQRPGGTLVVAATEPRTLNPLIAVDQPSRDAIYALSGDLIHINRASMMTEPALAASWKVSRDGRQYTITLRPGLRFSDGSPLTADDVVFTFQVHLDEKVNSTQHDLLFVDGKPITVTKLDGNSVRFDFPAPYAPAERLFDGIWILPRAKLEGHISQAWPEDTPGAGPFRFKQHLTGQRLILERNPYYWKKPLPYLDRLELSFASDANTQLLRLRAGEVDLLPRVRAEDFAALTERSEIHTFDAGPALEYNFVAFNWNAAGPSRAWFRNVLFRRAVAHAIDRDAIVKLVYQGKATPISSQVTPGNRLWRDDKVTQYAHDPAKAAALLQEAGFRRDASGLLKDASGRPVEFTLMVSASSALRRKMATLVEEDLARVGIQAHATPTEFGSMVDAVLHAGRFEAVLWGLSAEGDPYSEMNVWPTAGQTHLWNLRLKDQPAPENEAWEREVDKLMAAQMSDISLKSRKATYDRVQELVSTNLPVVFLATPHVLSATRAEVGGFTPAVLEPVALWNCERLYSGKGWK
jgi:peptide/nickel transport system substrate-binding protein